MNFSKKKKKYPSTPSRLIFGVGAWSRKFRRRMMEIPQIRYSHSFLGRWLGNGFLANQMRVEIREMIGCYHNHSFLTNERRGNEVNNHENDEKWYVFFFGVGKEWEWKNRNFEVRSGERDGGKREIWDLFEKRWLLRNFVGLKRELMRESWGKEW